MYCVLLQNLCVVSGEFLLINVGNSGAGRKLLIWDTTSNAIWQQPKGLPISEALYITLIHVYMLHSRRSYNMGYPHECRHVHTHTHKRTHSHPRTAVALLTFLKGTLWMTTNWTVLRASFSFNYLLFPVNMTWLYYQRPPSPSYLATPLTRRPTSPFPFHNAAPTSKSLSLYTRAFIIISTYTAPPPS